MLEQAIQENTQVMRELLAAFRSLKIDPPAAVAYKAAKAIEIEPVATSDVAANDDPDETPPTDPDPADWAKGLRSSLSTTVLAIAKTHSRQDAVKLIARFGAAKVSEVSDDMLAEALAAAEELLATLNDAANVEDAG